MVGVRHDNRRRCEHAVAILAVALWGCDSHDRATLTDAGADAGWTAAGGSGGSAGRGGSTSAGASSGAAGDRAAAGGTGGIRDRGTSGTAGSDAGTTSPDAQTPSASADSVWSPLTVMSVVNPKDHGAVGDGKVDDLPALRASVDALPPAGGIVYLPPGATFEKTDVLTITKSHVKWWAPNRQATIFQAIAGQKRHQSMLCRNQGCGFFGLKLTSDASSRFDALEDNQISADGATLVEVVGCEISGSAAAGVFLYGSKEHYIEGNYVHHTWADHIHHTNGAQQSWVWGNYIFNENPSAGTNRGDDGVACVTYGTASTRCGDMEWWHNDVLHTDWGRGYSVIGGNDITIHDNWAIGVAGAGIIVASEGSYDSSSSSRITIHDNDVTGCGHGIGHPGILISGLNTAAEPLSDITLTNNVSASNVNGAYRAEGAYMNVDDVGLKQSASDLPSPIPTINDVRLADTAVLRTRDVSHVTADVRPGLYRIHVRRAPSGDGFEQRFEYVVKGAPGVVGAFVAARLGAGDHLSETRELGASAYALLLTRAPVALPAGVAGVSFREMRGGDADGTLTWLWNRVDSGTY